MEIKKQKLVLTRGLPGCGKSTWAVAWVEEEPEKRIRINRDSLREMMGPYWVPSREPLAEQMEFLLVKSALDNDYDIVLDATNFKFDESRISLYIKMEYPNLEIEVKDFTDVPLDTCIERDSLRERKVGSMVIKSFYNKYIKVKEEV